MSLTWGVYSHMVGRFLSFIKESTRNCLLLCPVLYVVNVLFVVQGC